MPKIAKSKRSGILILLMKKSSPLILFGIAVAVIVFLVANRFLMNNQDSVDTSSPNAPQSNTGALDIAVCDPANGPLSEVIDNEFFPYPVGTVYVLEGDGSRVEISALDETELVSGITTQVVEEREWEGDELVEVSRNFYAQAPDKTVCYFGEEVDDYINGEIVGHGGAWRAGVGENKAGIIMPGTPAVGQSYQQEVAPGVAMDSANHEAMGETFTTPFGTFIDVLLVREEPSSTKRYQRGFGLIYDDGAVLTEIRTE